MSSDTVYNIDTSALIYLEKYYPRVDFELVWINFEQAFKDGRVYITDNVWKEIQAYEDKEDPLLSWMKDRKQIMVRVLKSNHILEAAKIIRENPEIVKDTASVDSAIKENADPYVIAHSLVEKTTILTGEKKYLNPKPLQIRIPHVCDKYGVFCISLKHGDQEAVVPLYLIQTLSLNKRHGIQTLAMPTIHADTDIN